MVTPCRASPLLPLKPFVVIAEIPDSGVEATADCRGASRNRAFLAVRLLCLFYSTPASRASLCCLRSSTTRFVIDFSTDLSTPARSIPIDGEYTGRGSDHRADRRAEMTRVHPERTTGGNEIELALSSNSASNDEAAAQTAVSTDEWLRAATSVVDNNNGEQADSGSAADELADSFGPLEASMSKRMDAATGNRKNFPSTLYGTPSLTTAAAAAAAAMSTKRSRLMNPSASIDEAGNGLNLAATCQRTDKVGNNGRRQ